MHPPLRGRRSARQPDAGSSDELFDGRSVLSFREASSRRSFLKGAAAVGVGATLVTATSSERAFAAQQEITDLEILEYALVLEQLEATFYTKGLDAGLLSGRTLELVAPIQDHEKAHVDTVTQTIKQLGGDVPAKPQFTFPSGTFSSKKKFLTTAEKFEEVGVTAYHGQVANIQSPAILEAAAAIVGVESRHAAILSYLINDPNTLEDAFEDNRTMQEVLTIVDPFIEGSQP